MYRPTVRYDEKFRSYVDDLFHATTLDRNQLIRLALFIAGHSEEYAEVLERYKKADVLTIPSASWHASQERLWMEQTYSGRVEEEDVNAIDRRKEGANEAAAGNGASTGTAAGRNRPLPSERIAIANKGGVVFTLD